MNKHTFHDCTQDKATITRQRVRSLVTLANELWDEGDLVGAEKAQLLVNHLRSEIDFLSDSYTRTLDQPLLTEKAA